MTSVSPPSTVRAASRPTIREDLTVLSLLAGGAVVFVDLIGSTPVRPVSIAAGLLVALTISGGLRTWWRARPKPVANHILVLLLTATAGFIALTMALGGGS